MALRGDGFVAAGFRHRTSRAGDPHLHTHVLVANATRSADGRWGALDARHLYLHAKTAGYLYEAQLRAELTARLGVAWGPVVNGIADVDGIPAAVLDRFSTRRREIEAEMAARGVSSARAAQYAVLDTRQAKDYDVEPSLLHTRWTEQAAELGWNPDQLESVLGQACPAALTAERVDKIRSRLLGPDGLTRQASTFDRRAVLRAWCDQLPEGADISLIETARRPDPRRPTGRAPRAGRPRTRWNDAAARDGTADRHALDRAALLDRGAARARSPPRAPRRRQHRTRYWVSPTRTACSPRWPLVPASRTSKSRWSPRSPHRDARSTS